MSDDLFLLDPKVTFLNHGSFGATPRCVLENQQHWQREMERQPVDFFDRRIDPLLAQAKRGLADLLHAEPEELAWVTNVTWGVNVVAHSLGLAAGDEVLLSDHEYGAVYRTFLYLSRRLGFSLKVAHLPAPLARPQQVVESVAAHISPATRLIVVSHITSPSGLLMPVADIIGMARQKGILTLIDGAHAPGQIDLDLSALGADFYVGNLHKWLSAPKSSAFLYVSPPHQARISPLVVGWAYEPKAPLPPSMPEWVALTEMLGTRDLSAFLAIPAALEFHARHHGPQVRAACRQQIQSWLEGLSDWAPRAGFPCPLQMGALLLPQGLDGARLNRWLWEEHRVEVPCPQVGERFYLRASYHSYNRPADLERLTALLRTFRPSAHA